MTLSKITTCIAIVFATSMSQELVHATFVNNSAEQENIFVPALKVPHGSEDGLDTTEVEICWLPEVFISTKPQPKPGWEREIIKGNYLKFYFNHVKEIKSNPVEIRWNGGKLQNDFYESFAFVDAEQNIPFKIKHLRGDAGTVSREDRAEARVDPYSLKNPASLICIIAKAQIVEHGHGNAAMDSGVVKFGSLELFGGATKAMMLWQLVGSGYVTIRNTGISDDRLIAVSSPVAGRAEIHGMAIVNNVMKMRKLDEKLPFRPGRRSNWSRAVCT